VPPGRVKILVPDVSAEMRAAVNAYAEEHDLSRNQVAVDALLARYGMDVGEGIGKGEGGYRPQEWAGNGPWSLGVPPKLRAKLRAEAARRGATISGLVRVTLAEKFGLPVEELVARRPKGRQ